MTNTNKDTELKDSSSCWLTFPSSISPHPVPAKVSVPGADVDVHHQPPLPVPLPLHFFSEKTFPELQVSAAVLMALPHYTWTGQGDKITSENI